MDAPRAAQPRPATSSQTPLQPPEGWPQETSAPGRSRDPLPPSAQPVVRRGWYVGVIAAVSIALLAAMIGGAVGAWEADQIGTGQPSRDRAPLATASHERSDDYLYLAITTDPANDLDMYLPANFTAPHGATIHVTIVNFDNGTNPVPADRALVEGTVGGILNIEGVGPSIQVDPTAVSHTFSIEGGACHAVNVPIPAAADAAHPAVVTFDLQFQGAGTCMWHCVAPCDPHSMGTAGYMTGSLTLA